MAATVLVIALIVVLLAWVVWRARGAWQDRRTDFIHRVAVSAERRQEVADSLLDRVLPVLVAAGYATVAQGGHTTILERRSARAWWPIVVAIVFFPVGLLALPAAARGSEDAVTFELGPRALEVRGRCGRLTADYLVRVLDEEAAGFPLSASLR